MPRGSGIRAAVSGTTWLVGADATRAERALVAVSALAGAGLTWWLFFRDQGWSWWLLLLALFITADLVGGAVANAAGSTKAQYQAPLPDGARWWTRIVHDPVAFTALHAYPLLTVLLYPGGTWWWGIGWYLGTVAAVALVCRVVPRYLQRPVAMTIFVLAVPVALAFPGPSGWTWLPLAYLAKLLLAHSVQEEAYRPTR